MKRIRVLGFSILFVIGHIPVQKAYCADPDSVKNVYELKYEKAPYKLQYKIDLPITIVALVGNTLGLQLIKKNTGIDDPTEITNLDPGKIPKFDRSALSLKSSYFERAHDLSNIGLNVGTILPVLLFIDKKMRADWLQLSVLYFESTLLFANVYIWGGPQSVTRYRPFLYYTDLPIEDRLGDFRKNSFFSGHASFTAVASFYMATTYYAYHRNANRILLYSLATIPPAFVSYYRYMAGKHFPSDVIVGTLVGAIGGIIVPFLHRTNKKHPNKSLTFNPILGSATGIRLSYHL